MRALLQRVSRASVLVVGKPVSEIGHGFFILLGIGKDDSEAQVRTLTDKIVHLRVFEDEDGKRNYDISVSRNFW